MKESEIIQGCKQKNRQAQKAFVERYSDLLFSICMRYTKDEQLSKDCLQESLIKILQSFNSYNEQGKFTSWISMICVRKCLDKLKKERRFQSFDTLELNDTSLSPSALYSLEYDDVMKFIDTLSDRLRIVINMYLVEGYSHKEIGDFLGIKESSSRSLLTRAKKMINDHFKSESLNVVHKVTKKKELVKTVENKISEKWN